MDKFVTGEWVPLGISPAAPPTKKKKKRRKRTRKQKSQLQKKEKKIWYSRTSIIRTPDYPNSSGD